MSECVCTIAETRKFSFLIVSGRQLSVITPALAPRGENSCVVACLAIGGQAGDSSSLWSRRAKIDIHDLPADLLEKALAGRVVEALLAGRPRTAVPRARR